MIHHNPRERLQRSTYMCTYRKLALFQVPTGQDPTGINLPKFSTIRLAAKAISSTYDILYQLWHPTRTHWAQSAKISLLDVDCQKVMQVKYLSVKMVRVRMIFCIRMIRVVKIWMIIFCVG